MQFSELEDMKSVRSNNSLKQKYEKVSQNDDKSEIVIFQTNKIISVSFFCVKSDKTKKLILLMMDCMI